TEPEDPASVLRVMIVDDNPDAALMLSVLLEATGYDVVIENSSGGGLALAARCTPGVGLLDIGLPGMDGYQLARRVRALPGMEQATLIAITGYGQAEDRRKTRDAGFQHHLVKPVDTAELLTLLQALSETKS
ncbi:MAG: response regulator, partial [Massilia sp.]|nr:response regulator [Massilia sp.]